MITKFESQLAENGKCLQDDMSSASALTHVLASSTTPTGTPPQSAVALAGNAFAASAPAPAQNVSDILKGLASFAPSNTAQQAPAPVPTPAPLNMNSYPQGMPVNGTSVQFPPVGGQQGNLGGANQNMQANPLAALLAGGGLAQHQQPPQQPAYGMPPQPPQPAPGMPGVDPNMMKQLAILQQLKAMNVPQEQWATLLPFMMSQAMPPQPGAAAAMPMPNTQGQFPPMQYGGVQADQSRDGYETIRSPGGRERRRSRSPGYGRRDESPPRRRDSPTYGRYGEEQRDAGRRGGRERERGGRNRNRSPDRFRRSPSPRRQASAPTGSGNDTDWGYIPRNMSIDPTLPKDSIRVYSRTLFVGGVTCSEDELRRIFSAHGRVQTCIVNIDKRHAFVKMLTREEAIRAKEAMEHYRTDSMQLRTRWGVGYGPRDCSDYGTGVSVIPIGRLTDADRKWMLSAPYGGSGGEEIKGGLTVEEPDIEIGAGVSSKAISRRMQTDRSGQHGPRSSRDQGGQGGGRRRGGDEDNPNNMPVAPQVPNYGFNFTNMGNGGGANSVPLGMNQNYGQGA